MIDITLFPGAGRDWYRGWVSMFYVIGVVLAAGAAMAVSRRSPVAAVLLAASALSAFAYGGLA